MCDGHDPVLVGVIGLGAMGSGVCYQCSISPKVACVAVADIEIDRCVVFLNGLGKKSRVVENCDAMCDAIRRGAVAVCEDGSLIAQCEMLDAVVEASSCIWPAGEFAVKALQNRKHLILMNSEIDLLFGPALMCRAATEGVVYTSIDGDQYGVLKHLIDEIKAWGFACVMAGNMKGFLDRYANPTTIVAEADKRQLDYRMCTAFTDGTKLAVEMALVANSFGMRTTVPGMLGPRAAHIQEALGLFDFTSQWDGQEGFVDYLLGAEPGGSVFAVGYCDNPYQRRMLVYYKMGNGPYYLFYRPYHLCHIESVSTIVDAVRCNKPLMQPEYGFRTNVYAYAKKDLKRGETLDGIGGYTCYGLIQNCVKHYEDAGLPICLAKNVVMKRDILKDQAILLSDVSVDWHRPDFSLFTEAASFHPTFRR